MEPDQYNAGNLFHCKGNDGSTVLVHTYDAYDNDDYNMLMLLQALDEVWRKHAGKDRSDMVIATYGWATAAGAGSRSDRNGVYAISCGVDQILTGSEGVSR